MQQPSTVTSFYPSDYLVGKFEQLFGYLSAMTASERRNWLRPKLRLLNAWERSTLIGAMRFLIGSLPSETTEES